MFHENVYPEFFTEGDTMRVRIHGEIDHHTAKPLREEIDRALRRQRPKTLLLDLQGVSFMDSSGLGLIMGRMNTAEEVGASLALCHVGERIMRILKMAGLARMKITVLDGKKDA